MASREKILTGFGLGEIPLAEKGENGPKVEFDSRKEFFATYLRYAQDPSIHVEYIPAIKTTDEVLDDGTFWRKRDVIGGVLKRDGVAVLAFRDAEQGPSFQANEFKIDGAPLYDFSKHNRYQALLEAGKLTPDEVRLLTNNSPLPLSG